MKKIEKVILLFLSIILLNGCVKNHTTITINSDKSMIYENEFLLASQFIESGEGTINETAIQNLESKGYKVELAKDNDNYSGYKMSKEFKSIDDVSNNNGEVVVVSQFGTDEFDESKLFKLEQGFLKNKYTANFKYNSDDIEDQMDNNVNETESENETSVVNEESGAAVPLENKTIEETNESEEDNETLDLADFGDLLALESKMEFTYVVNLPVKALSNNATSVENDGKTLKWNLKNKGDNSIQFSFELYNMTNIYIVCGCIIVLIIVIVIVSSLIAKKKRKAKEGNFNPTIINDTQEGEAPISGISMEEVVSSIESVANEEVAKVNTEVTENQEEVVPPTLEQSLVQEEQPTVSEPTPVEPQQTVLQPPVIEESTPGIPEPPVAEPTVPALELMSTEPKEE